jgi:hypothetical protein
MKNRARRHREPQSSSNALQKALEFWCTAMHSRDVNWLQISEILSAKADECRRRNSDDAMGISMETDAARWLAASKIVHDWYRLPQFVDQTGKPRALKLWGTTDSIEALARVRLASSKLAKNAVKSLVEIRGCKRTTGGRYIPSSYTLNVARKRDVMENRGALLFGCLADTFEHNMREENPADREFERTVHSQRLKATEVAAFRYFMAAQGEAFIEVLDQWLEERQARLGESSLEVNIEVFTHAADMHGHVGLRNSGKTGSKQPQALSQPHAGSGVVLTTMKDAGAGRPQ